VQIVKKCIYFGADGAIMFQGHKGGVTKLLNNTNAPYMTGLYCVAHMINLVAIYLEKLPMMKKIEALCNALYCYFSKSPTMDINSVCLADEVNNLGNKILHNVKTRWISSLPPTKRVLKDVKYLLLYGRKRVYQQPD
jgi:hypothetical protein